MNESANRPAEREIGVEALKALAHPLRVAIFNALSEYGPATATGLASRLGESSGATSYHLRQLARHDLVREVADRGTTRERWWERTPGGVTISPRGADKTPATQAAAQLVLREWYANRDAQLRAFFDEGEQLFSDEWVDASAVTSSNAQLTAEQLAAFTEEYQQLLDALLDKYRGQHIRGSRPVQIQFSAFPLVGGEESAS